MELIMPATMTVGGLDAELVTDIIRFSDGRVQSIQRNAQRALPSSLKW